MTKTFIVDDISELYALQRVFREAKFCTEPDDTDIPYSPIVADLFNRLMLVLIENDVQQNDEEIGLRWQRWLAMDDPRRAEWGAAIYRAKIHPKWSNFSIEKN